MNDELMKEYIAEKKRERREKSMANVGKLLGAFGKMMPKGIRHPDSLVTNHHLYSPRYKGKKAQLL